MNGGDTVRRLWTALRNLIRARQLDRDLSDDVDGFAEMLADEKIVGGLDADAARRAARLEMGGVDVVKEHVRERRAGAGAERLWQDVRYSWRSLRRTPAFSVVAVVTLALGLAATTIMFSVVDAALLKPLPFARPNELVDMAEILNRGTREQTAQFGLSWTQIAQWRREVQIFSGVEAFKSPGATPFTWRETGEVVQAGAFTAGLPGLLGLTPTIGRTITEDEIDHDVPVVLISDALWRRAFERDRGVIGKTMTLNDRGFTIVGVMPKSLRFGPGLSGRADLWTGLSDRPLADRAIGADPVFRLRPGLSLDAAQIEVDRAAARIQDALAITNASPSVKLGFKPAATWDVDLYPFDRRVWSSTARSAWNPLIMLFGTTLIVLLIACANVSNLIVARHAARKLELALRASLGATRARLLRLLMIDGLVLALGAGACAMLLSWWCVSTLPTFVSSRVRMTFFSVALPAIDWRVWAFTFTTAIAVGVLSSVMPALRESRPALSTRAVGASRATRTMSLVLQATQVGLSFVLVTGAGLLAWSYYQMRTADLGFEENGLTSMSVQLPAARYADAAAQRLFFDEALARVRAVPGVSGASLGSLPVATSSGGLVAFGKEDESRLPTSIRYAGSDYFAVTGVPIRSGRAFGDVDRPSAEPAVIVDERVAAALWPGQSAIGQKLRYSPYVPWLTVVGVSGWAASYDFASRGADFGIYLAQSQQPPSLIRSLLVRTAPDDRVAVPGVVRALTQMEPAINVTRVRTAASYLDESDVLRAPQLYMTLMSALAGLALLTAMVGLYGLLSYALGQRTREIGVRIALGSSLGRIRSLVIRDAMRPVVLGLVAGVIGAHLSSVVLASFLYNVSPRDWRIVAISGGVLIATALLAAVGPIRRAGAVDPVVALRLE